jgi:putative salt-induced outer membrane protein
MTRSLVSSLAATVFLLASTAHAEDPKPPEGTLKQDAASSGKTELEGQGKFAKAADADEETDATELDISLGGMLSTGNARAMAGTGLTKFRLRRGMHQFSSALVGNYGRAAVDRTSDPVPTVGNVQGRARYDIFFAKHWAAFLMATARHDPFLGIDVRVNVDPGFAYHVLTNKKHRLWFEAGYDFQYDLRAPEAIIERDEDGDAILDSEGETIQIADEYLINHAARLFAGYVNRLSDHVTFETGLEYLQSVLKASRWRINWDVALAAQVAERLSVAATFSLRADNDPLPNVAKLDTMTAASLVYRFF